jgi:acetolactate synthase-1/2/3 large subunit
LEYGNSIVGKNSFTKFSNPDFVKLTESFGAIGYNVKSTEELPRVLKEAKTKQVSKFVK